MRYGRSRPYTERGLRRLPCTRCGKPATQQWRACSDGRWRPICTKCDIALNRLVLLFMRDSAVNEKISKYQEVLNV